MMTMDELPVPPDAIFGMLLAQEGGATLDHMAHVYGLARNSIAALLDMARRGECPRIEASSGDMRVPMRKGTSGHGPVAADFEEVLVQRWMRRVARHLHRHGEIRASDLRNLLGENGISGSQALNTLRTQFKPLGIAFAGKQRNDTLPDVLVLDMDSQKPLADLIAADWRVEVAR